MSSRLKWTPEEQQILRSFGGSDKKNKWTIVAQLINQRQPAFKRTPKQCREKYNNHLIFGQKKFDSNWTKTEDEILFNEYKDKGPKWKIISESFPSKSQNSIKNRFYGNVRKAVRKLNKIGKQKISRSFKPIRQKSIIRIIQPDTGLLQASQKISSMIESLRLKLLDKIEKGIQQQETGGETKIQQIIELIKEVHKFNCSCRFYRNAKSRNQKKLSAYKKQRKSTDINDQDQRNEEQQQQLINDQEQESQGQQQSAQQQFIQEQDLKKKQNYERCSKLLSQTKKNDEQIKQKKLNQKSVSSDCQPQKKEIIKPDSKPQENFSRQTKNLRKCYFKNYRQLVSPKKNPRSNDQITQKSVNKNKSQSEKQNNFFAEFHRLVLEYCQTYDKSEISFSKKDEKEKQ